MQLPFFYIEPEETVKQEIQLNEENSRHIVQVLRMKKDEPLNLTDGEGRILTCRIVNDHKKHCTVSVEAREQVMKPLRQVTIGISILKNSNRFEWFMEKATELGVSRIVPLICQRTEKEKFRLERLKGICISAMLQSRQAWLPLLNEAAGFEKAILALDAEKKFIGYCGPETERKQLVEYAPFQSAIALIGPEGDFTKEEMEFARLQGFLPVSLGGTRLRTETAGVVAATLLMNA